jgi:hypothetical protein
MVGQTESGGQDTYDVAVARYTTDGERDLAFADSGKLTVDFFGGGDSGNDAVVQPDGRVLVSGSAPNNVGGTVVVLLRLNP